MEKIQSLILKDGRKVEIILPSMKYLHQLTDFVNKLSREDTYLTWEGEQYSVAYEKNWLNNALNEIKFDKSAHFWAVYDDKIIGAASINRGATRSKHVASIGVMVVSDYRGLGLGSILMQKIINKSKDMNLKILKLDVFDDNLAGKKLYEKFGFLECGRIPNGLYRKGKYSDDIIMFNELE